MKSEVVDRTVLIRLPATFIDALLKMRGALDKDLASVLETGLTSCSASVIEFSPEKKATTTKPSSGKHTTEFFGIPFVTRTLPEAFAEIVDMTAEVAPEALDSLSEVKARTRRFVARRPEAIHPGNPGLPVMQTTSGWWISKNVGQEDLKRALRALCNAAGLTFGRDVKFPLERSSE